VPAGDFAVKSIEIMKRTIAICGLEVVKCKSNVEINK
jgi:hypothetical protein